MAPETPFPPRLASLGLDPDRVIFCRCRNDTEALAALEEALRTKGIAAAIGEIANVTFTQSRRLHLICEASGADVTMLARAIGYDSRIGNKFLRAGVGFGGGCLPKDIRAFQARAQELGAGEALRFLHEVDLINLRRRTRVLQVAAELLDRKFGPAGPDLSGQRIAVLGATFKPNTDDVRDAPALAVAALLHKAGADVRVYDPEGMENARRALPNVTYESSMADAVTGADLVCVLTEWADFRNADPQVLGRLVAGKRVIDGRNCLDSQLWVQAGWQYRGMGRP